MPSPEAIKAKQQLHKEIVDADKTPADERKEWDDYAKSLPLAQGAVIDDITLGGVPCARIKPQNGESKATILYAHGGGLTVGSILTHRSLASHLAMATKCEIILPDYRLLPENEISAPSDDIFNVLMALNEDDMQDLPIFIGGDSSGAGLALLAAKRFIDQGETFVRGCALKGCFAISGAFDASLSGKSHIKNSDIDPILSLPVLQHWQNQLGADIDLESPTISPLFADLDALVPTLLIAGEDEVWLDDTLRMHEKLTQSQVPCEIKIYKDMWHVWPMTPDLPETDEAYGQITQFIDQHLA